MSQTGKGWGSTIGNIADQLFGFGKKKRKAAPRAKRGKGLFEDLYENRRMGAIIGKPPYRGGSKLNVFTNANSMLKGIPNLVRQLGGSKSKPGPKNVVVHKSRRVYHRSTPRRGKGQATGPNLHLAGMMQDIKPVRKRRLPSVSGTLRM